MNPLDSHMHRGTDRIDTVPIIIIADDLTGACDSGIAFIRTGCSMRVLLDASHSHLKSVQQLQAHGDRSGLALTTETRNGSPEQARRRVLDCMAALEPALPAALLFKKIDSAGRGHLGMEISTTLQASGAALALVAPAFPAAGRTVHSGILKVCDCSGQDAAISLADLFPHEDASRVASLPLGTKPQIEQGIERALAQGTKILLCDSTSQADLETLVAAALEIEQPLLWSGSAGLAHALASILPASAPIAPPPNAHRPGRTLLFVGTPHLVTDLQVSRLQQQSSEIHRNVLRVSWAKTAEREIAAAFTAEPVAALILTGGDTAMFVLGALGASSIVLAGEIAPGIPWGVIEGGLADGCIVITKSGGFGHSASLVEAFEFCERRACETA
jgi:uncharacterized protein YgbK (DUF1537 family)